MEVDLINESNLIEYLESQSFANASSSAPRLITKLKSALSSHELYEAHQIIRTIHFRFLRSDDKYKPLTKLIYLGAIYLIDEGEASSGQDLAILFLEACSKTLQHHRQIGDPSELNPDEDRLLEFHRSHATLELAISEMVSELALVLPQTELGRKRFLSEVFKNLNGRIIHPHILHDTIARKFSKKDEFASSRYHYLMSANLENAEDIAKVLVKYNSSLGNQAEADMFITQFIFQYLCIQSPIDQVSRPQATRGKESLHKAKTRSQIKAVASKIFATYAEIHPMQLKTTLFSNFPLLNFLDFLLRLLDTAEVRTFNLLRKIYEPLISRDPLFKEHLNKIATVYFGLPNPNENRSGILGNIMQMFNANDDDDEDDEFDDLE